MGREVRRVPCNWVHPKDERGRHIPLFTDFKKRAEQWDLGKIKWDEGLKWDWMHKVWIPKDEDDAFMSYPNAEGERPRPEEYMPDWPEEECTHFQMYETCSEGTPISPVLSSPEILAHWLADNRASAFGDMTASCEQWLAMIGEGSAVSAMIAGGVIMPGVALASQTPKPPPLIEHKA